MESSFCTECNEALHIRFQVWFPDQGIMTRIKNVALGLFVGLGSFFAMSALFYFLYTKGYWSQNSQDAFKPYDWLNNAHPILYGTGRCTLRVVIVLISPFLEEVVFRGAINSAVANYQGEHAKTLQKIARIFLVSLLFGAAHISPWQSTMTNIILFGSTTIAGITLGSLMEQRKDLTAPIAAHIAYNLGTIL